MRAVPVETEEVDAGPLRAYVARPAGKGPHPGVLVLHEMFGLNDDIRRIARRFAEHGYVAMAPDVWSHGNKAVCLSRALVDLARGAGGRALDDLVLARNALAARVDVDPSRIAVVGFCMGGGFALLLGTKQGVKAAAVNYGPVPKARDALDGVCPVVASYGTLDSIFTKQGRRLEEYLDALGVPHDVKFYDGVGHSFLNKDNAPGWMLRLPSPMRPGYSEAEAEDAWARMLAFFSEHV